MRIYDVIANKRDKKELSKEEIEFFVNGFTNGEIADYQASALLMAICFNGMNEDETFVLTEEMMNSGEIMDLSIFGDTTVDKHSTGGVGDKTTLVVAPIVAACGCMVPRAVVAGSKTSGTSSLMIESRYRVCSSVPAGWSANGVA